MMEGGAEVSVSNPVHPWLVPALLPFSWLYQAGLEVYLQPYGLGIRKRHKLPCRVVSVGNLTFGGTGKSPAVRAICRKLVARGMKPAVLSRGHGGRLCRVGAIASDGRKRMLDAMDCGDEPALLADALSGVPVAIGKNRIRMGSEVVERFRPDVMVLDDGMQYWQLHRDVEVVLVNAAAPFGTGQVMPAGTLREPVRGIRRADVVVVTGVEAVERERADSLAERLSSMAPRAEVFFARRLASALIDGETGERTSTEKLQGMSVVAVSGIANPASFEATVAGCGAEIRERMRFGDHCSYSEEQVKIVENALKSSGAEAVVTTAKDAVKLRLNIPRYVLDMELHIEDVDRFIDIVVGSS